MGFFDREPPEDFEEEDELLIARTEEIVFASSQLEVDPFEFHPSRSKAKDSFQFAEGVPLTFKQIDR